MKNDTIIIFLYKVKEALYFNSFGRLVDLCGLLLKSSKWTKWPNPLNPQGGLKVSNHLLAEWSRVDFLLYPYRHKHLINRS